MSDRGKVFVPKLISYHSLKIAAILHCLQAFSNKSLLRETVDSETIIAAIQLTRFFAGQAVKALNLYTQPETLNEYQKRLIVTLHKLQHEVHKGRLIFSSIRQVFNEGLPASLQHSPEKLGRLIKGLGLHTENGTGNIVHLTWEPDKMTNLFDKIALTSLITLTQDSMTPEIRVNEVNDESNQTEVVDLDALGARL